MDKGKTLMNTVKTFSFWEWLHVMAVIGGLAALIIACVNHLNNQKADTDRKIEEMQRRTENLDASIKRLENSINELRTELKAELKELKGEIKKTSDLLRADLSWRYLYQSHPRWKNLVPQYDLDTRTLEFVDSRGNVRNP